MTEQKDKINQILELNKTQLSQELKPLLISCSETELYLVQALCEGLDQFQNTKMADCEVFRQMEKLVYYTLVTEYSPQQAYKVMTETSAAGRNDKQLCSEIRRPTYCRSEILATLLEEVQTNLMDKVSRLYPLHVY